MKTKMSVHFIGKKSRVNALQLEKVCFGEGGQFAWILHLENSPTLYPGYHLCLTPYKIFLYSIYEIDTPV